METRTLKNDGTLSPKLAAGLLATRSRGSMASPRADDCSFDRDKTLLRTVTTKGYGVIVREGSECTVHFSVHAPSEVSTSAATAHSLGHPPPLLPTTQNGEVLLFDSSVAHRGGITFVPGRTLHAEALERGVLGLHPGSVADVVCMDAAAGSDSELGIVQPPLPDALQQLARTKWEAELQAKAPPLIAPRESLPPLPPAASLSRWHVRVVSATEGVIAMELHGRWRLDWCEESKAEANALFKRGDAARANRRYKKAMLDLEVPTQWEADDNVRRNQLRLSLHLNVAACGLRATDAYGATRYLDTISHASRVLEADPTNVKALFRRGQAHLLRPNHINGLALALEDLRRAAELEPGDTGVRSMLARARAQQKSLDQKDASMFGRMLG